MFSVYDKPQTLPYTSHQSNQWYYRKDTKNQMFIHNKFFYTFRILWGMSLLSNPVFRTSISLSFFQKSQLYLISIPLCRLWSLFQDSDPDRESRCTGFVSPSCPLQGTILLLIFLCHYDSFNGALPPFVEFTFLSSDNHCLHPPH